MLSNLSAWLDHRLGYRKIMDALLLEDIPGGAKWRYVWGSTLAFVFAIQMITGILLMLRYSPGDTTAWGSVFFIQYEMDFGWFIRGLHHFGSQTMVVLLAVHMLQVVVAGAQLPPREFNWWIGLGLMGIVLGLSLTGYLLPWDQKGYYATRVATNIAGNIPVVGDMQQRVIVGGPEYGNHTLTQFFTLHVGILPPLMVVLIIAHLAIFRRHGITAPANAKGMDLFWPAQAFRDLVACLAVFGVMVGLVMYGFGNKIEETLDRKTDHLGIETQSVEDGLKIKKVVDDGPAAKAGVHADDILYQIDSAKVFNLDMLYDALESHQPGDEVTLKVLRGTDKKKLDLKATLNKPGFYEDWARAGRKGLGANLDAPADRLTADYPARPEWYFLFLFQLLTYFEGPHFLVGTVFIPGAVAALLFLLPLLGYGRMRKFGHAVGVIVVVALLLAVAGLTFLAVVDDSDVPILGFKASNQKKAEDFRKDLAKAEKASERAVFLAHFGIPEEGARILLRNDPLTKGPKIFQAKCASCHAHASEPVSEDAQREADEKALKEVVKNLAEKKGVGKIKVMPVKYASDLTGFGTYDWIRGLLKDPGSPNYFGLAKKKVDGEDKELDGMIEWRKTIDTQRESWKKQDPVEGEKKIKEQDQEFDRIALFLADQGKPKLKRDKSLEDGRALFMDRCSRCHSLDGKGKKKAPDLTDYGSSEWLRLMIMSPANKTRHGDNNLMPAFRPKDGPAAEISLREFAEVQPKATILELSDVEREVLIRWLVGDTDRVVFGGQPISGPAPGAKSK